jgi:hypothetical protein
LVERRVRGPCPFSSEETDPFLSPTVGLALPDRDPRVDDADVRVSG